MQLYLYASLKYCLHPYTAYNLKNVWLVYYHLPEDFSSQLPSFTYKSQIVRLAQPQDNEHHRMKIPSPRHVCDLCPFQTAVNPSTEMCAVWEVMICVEQLKTLYLIYYFQNKLTEYKIRKKSMQRRSQYFHPNMCCIICINHDIELKSFA